MAIGDDNDTDVEKQLDRLQPINQMPTERAVDAEGDIAIGLERVAIGVHAEEEFPEEEAAVAGHEGEDGVEDDAGAVAHGCEGPSVRSLCQSSIF